MANSLLGFFQPQPDPLTSLLGEYYDPKTARMKWLGGTLQGLGVGLASGEPGAWASGMTLGGGEALDNYRREGIVGYGLNERAQDRARKQAEEQQAAEEEAQKQAALDQFMGSIPPEQRSFAQAFPTQFAQQYGKTLFPDPQGAGGNMKSYAPLPYEMGGGQVGYGIPMEDGSFRPVQTPEGAQFLSPYAKSYQQNLGAQEGKAIGEARGDVPGARKQAEMTTMRIDNLLKNPNLDAVVGWNSYRPDWLASNEMISLRGDIRGLMGSAFLEARQMLKGGGQITDYEGKKAEQAYTAMETAMQSSNVNDFKKALSDFRDAVQSGVAKLEATARVPMQPSSGGPVEDPLGIRR